MNKYFVECMLSEQRCIRFVTFAINAIVAKVNVILQLSDRGISDTEIINMEVRKIDD